jgi:hypothetical protein
MAPRRGVLLVEIDATGYVMEGGFLLAAAWVYRRRLGVWRDSEAPPARLRAAAASCSLVVGYDIHALIGPHLSHRWCINLRWPRLDMRIATGRTPVELALLFPPIPSSLALPCEPDLAGLVRRLMVVDAAWRWMRSRR